MHPSLVTFVTDLTESFEIWASSLQSNTSDALARQSVQQQGEVLDSIRKDLGVIRGMVARCMPVDQPADVGTCTPAPTRPSLGLLAALERGYDGPGELSPEGPRHDNGG